MNVLTATQLLLQLLAQANQLGLLLQRAQADGRDITDEELDELVGNDESARSSLDAAIAQAKGEGR